MLHLLEQTLDNWQLRRSFELLENIGPAPTRPGIQYFLVISKRLKVAAAGVLPGNSPDFPLHN
jgi:hypothetical protein